MPKLLKFVALLLLVWVCRADAATFTLICGNHNPQHAAKSIDEAKEMTKTYKCGGWKVIANGSTMTSEEEAAILRKLNDALGRSD